MTAIHFTYIISEFQTKVWISCSCRLKILTLLRCKIIGGTLKSLYITNINTYIFKTFIWFAYNSTIIFPFSNVYVPVNKKGKNLFVFQFFFSLKSENAFSFKQNYQNCEHVKLLVFDLQHHILLYTDITPICSRLYIIIRHWKLIYESLRSYNTQPCTTWFVIGPMITKLTFSAYIFILFLFSCCLQMWLYHI